MDCQLESVCNLKHFTSGKCTDFCSMRIPKNSCQHNYKHLTDVADGQLWGCKICGKTKYTEKGELP